MNDITQIDFRFTFGHDYDKETTYFFTVAGPIKKMEELNEDFDNHDGDFAETCDNLESEYGVHDCCSEGTEIAYDSYEVESHEYLPLMTKWRDWFVGQGFYCGDITLRPNTTYFKSI